MQTGYWISYIKVSLPCSWPSRHGMACLRREDSYGESRVEPPPLAKNRWSFVAQWLRALGIRLFVMYSCWCSRRVQLVGNIENFSCVWRSYLRTSWLTQQRSPNCSRNGGQWLSWARRVSFRMPNQTLNSIQINIMLCDSSFSFMQRLFLYTFQNIEYQG